MDLKKFLPGAGDKEKIEHFWALVIEPGWVQAGIWRIQNQRAQVIYTSSESAWELDEELVNACDTALSSAIQDYPDEYEEPTKTVFGVSYNWVSGGEIKQEYLDKIKRICKELSLTPVGFVVLPEAISHLVKSEEGAPLNAVILGVYKDNVEVSLFELGKLVGTTQVARSVSLIDDSVEGLSRLKTGDTLPSRFLVYDGKEGELEDIRQIILKSNWEDLESLKFLHTPKVELIDSKRKVYAVSLAGASELANITNLEDIGLSTGEDGEEVSEDFSDPASLEDETSPEELGFALEKDVAEDKGDLETEELKDGPLPEQDAMELDLPTETETKIQEMESNVKPAPPDVFERKEERKVKKFTLPLTGIKTGLLKTLSLPGKIRLGKSPILFVMGALVILLLLSIAGWWFLPKAEVTIFISPQRLEETVSVEIDSGRGDSDISGRVLSGDIQKTTVSGDRTKETTGAKTVGDKASGEITIYRVGPELTLNAGTLVNGPEKLKFSLDNTVTIASGSASTPGETKVKVSAESIGAQHNLASGTTFTIGNYSTSDMEAKNNSAFSGGTSREINAVSKDDMGTLQEDLTKELEGKAKEQLGEGISSERILVEKSQVLKNVQAEFNHKEGDEADTLRLSLVLDVESFSVRKSDMENLAKEVLKEKIPSGFVLRGEQVEYEFEKESSEEDSSRFKVKIAANLLPEIDVEEITKKIVGRNPKIAQQYLQKEVPGYVKAEIKITPALPEKLKTLPHVVQNIAVELAASK